MSDATTGACARTGRPPKPVVEPGGGLAVRRPGEVSVLECKSCGGALDLTMASCPSCGADVPMGRITGILGLVCRHCDAYNEPGAKTCIYCDKPLGSAPEDAAEASGPSTAPAPAASASPGTASLP